MFTFPNDQHIMMEEDIANSYPLPPEMPRKMAVAPFWLFVYPCGTPMDFCFSSEVLPERAVYWSKIIPVSCIITSNYDL
jgi:hypothetical protein